MEISRLRAELARVKMERDIAGKSDGVLRESAGVKYVFVQRLRQVWPISAQCRVLRMSMAEYHEHFVRKAIGTQLRHLSEDALLVHIKAIHTEADSTSRRNTGLSNGF